MPEQKSTKAFKSAARSSGTGWQSAMKSKPVPQTNVIISSTTRRRPKKGSAVHPDIPTTASQNSDDTGGAQADHSNKKSKKKVGKTIDPKEYDRPFIDEESFQYQVENLC